jgi:hypothetical protein
MKSVVKMIIVELNVLHIKTLYMILWILGIEQTSLISIHPPPHQEFTANISLSNLEIRTNEEV